MTAFLFCHRSGHPPASDEWRCAASQTPKAPENPLQRVEAAVGNLLKQVFGCFRRRFQSAAGGLNDYFFLGGTKPGAAAASLTKLQSERLNVLRLVNDVVLTARNQFL
jgi:hypothetical protein